MAKDPKESSDVWDIPKKCTKQKKSSLQKQPGESTQLDIVEDGDLCLMIQAPSEKEEWTYRVSSQTLIKNSAYFKALLQAGRYSEGIAFEVEKRKILEAHNNDLHCLPHSSLPVISISDFGAIPRDASLKEAFEVMLHILHGTHQFKQPIRLQFIAILAIIADRFDVAQPLGEYFRHQELFIDSMRRPYSKIFSRTNNLSIDETEEVLRQMLLIALFFGVAEAITHCSSRLIISGSKVWTSIDPVVTSPGAWWWDLPHGLEEELLARRNAILATLASLQQHFIAQYSNPRILQCKLGYDTSPACDTYQLGAMIRFFTRCGTLKVGSTFYQSDADLDPTPYAGNLFNLYQNLKACPSPQIDSNHKHCGLRSRFIPALEHIFYYLGDKIEVCGDCWVNGTRTFSWSQNPARGKWKYNENVKNRQKYLQRNHGPAREMFTADTWDWTPNP